MPRPVPYLHLLFIQGKSRDLTSQLCERGREGEETT